MRPAPARLSRTQRLSRRSSKKSPPPALPSAAPARTINAPKPPWKTESGRGISDDHPRTSGQRVPLLEDGSAPIFDGGERGRRQEHAYRPAPLRHKVYF